MGYARRCPGCGAFLDPGEICDCEKRAALDGANIEDGKQKLSANSIAVCREAVKPRKEGRA